MKKIALALLILYIGVSQITRVYGQNYENIPPPQYLAESVVVMDVSTGMVLYGANAHELKYPASITKIMTALVALEHTTDFNQRIQFTQRAIDETRGTAHIYMDVGETLSIYEALHAIMLPSANEVAIALAEHVAGEVEDFVALMNRRATNLGALNTNFANPTGLPEAGHVTTAYDMALIMREAINHPLFVDIINTRTFEIPPTERQPEVRLIRNTNRLIHPGPEFDPHVIGSKTGWTTPAGHTLVTYGRDNGRSLIVSVLGTHTQTTFDDTVALLNYGFALPFTQVQIFDASANTPTVPVFQNINGARQEVGRVPLAAQNNLYHSLPPNFDPSQLRYEFNIPQGLAPPVEAGTALGSVSIYVENFRLGITQLVAMESAYEYVPHAQDYAQEYAEYVPAAAPMPTLGTYDYIPISPYAPQGIFTLELLMTLAVPVVVSVTTLLISLLVYLLKRKSRAKRYLHAKYARYPHYYKYK